MAGATVLAVGLLATVAFHQRPANPPASKPQEASTSPTVDARPSPGSLPSQAAGEDLAAFSEPPRPNPEPAATAKLTRSRPNAATAKTAARGERKPSDLAPNPY
jgi:hypothetical protein